jgi:hypothetical protein
VSLPPNAADPAIDALLDPDTDAVAFVARGTDGGLFAYEFGDENLGYEDVVELTAYQLISLEDQSEKGPQETVRDVVQKRNELRRTRDVLGSGEGGSRE